jgi:hypothetical protein
MNRLVRRAARPFVRRLDPYITSRADHILRTKVSLTPFGEFEPDDIFIMGYPKSGSTWFQSLVAGAIYGLDLEYAPFSVLQDLIPGQLTQYYRRHSTPMFFRSHDLPAPTYRRVIYVLRDGRDVMVSAWHWASALAGRHVDFERIVQGDLGPGSVSWHRHVDAWLDNPYGAQMLVVRYEDLLADPIRELERLCAFVGEERSRDMLQTAVDKASFQSLRRKEQKQGTGYVPFPRNKEFFRRGKAGSFLDEMPPEVLDRFLAVAGPTMRRCGYLTGEPEVPALDPA